MMKKPTIPLSIMLLSAPLATGTTLLIDDFRNLNTMKGDLNEQRLDPVTFIFLRDNTEVDLFHTRTINTAGSFWQYEVNDQAGTLNYSTSFPVPNPIGTSRPSFTMRYTWGLWDDKPIDPNQVTGLLVEVSQLTGGVGLVVRYNTDTGLPGSGHSATTSSAGEYFFSFAGTSQRFREEGLPNLQNIEIEIVAPTQGDFSITIDRISIIPEPSSVLLVSMSMLLAFRKRRV